MSPVSTVNNQIALAVPCATHLPHTGEEDEKERLEKLVASDDPELYWSNYHSKLLSTRQNDLKPKPEKDATRDPDTAMQDAETATAPASLPRDKRGPEESIDSFVKRLTPSKTKLDEVGPWIWVYGKPQVIESGDVPTFTRKGLELLHAYEEKSAELRAAHDKSGSKTMAPLTRKLTPMRRDLEKAIFALARETRVTAGKWMLFPSVAHVDGIWKRVAQAVVSGKLSSTAKVATDDGSGNTRLVCVYTPDFGDAEDVKRVIKAMAELGLVNPGERPIYYKCDAYTYLDITSKNEYGLKASMFSSRDVLKH